MMSDEFNPYRAETVIDEKSVDMVRLVHRTPEPRTTSYQEINRVTFQAFMQEKWRFLGLGIAQILFFGVPAVLIGLLIDFSSQAEGDLGLLFPVFVFLGIGGIFLLGLLIYIASVSATLRLLRK